MKSLTPQIVQKSQEELKISIKSSFIKNSPIPTSLKQKSNVEVQNLIQTLLNVMKEKGDHFNEKIHQVRTNELEFDKYSLSYATLQSFLIKAEALGKNITFEKIYTVKITD